MGGVIRSVPELLRAIYAGGRLMHVHSWAVSQDTNWREWIVVYRDGTRQSVDARIAVTAHRKGMVTFDEKVRPE